MSAISKTTKKKKAKKQKLKHSNIVNLPTDIKDYVTLSSQHCLPEKQTELQKELRSIIKNTKAMTDCNENSSLKVNGNITKPKRKRTKNKKPSLTTASSSTGGIIDIESTPEELRRREQRLMRFATTTSSSSQQVQTSSPSSNNNNENWRADGKIIGTSRDIEKPYFRLTSAPDPSTVRPLTVLQNAYNNVKKKWNNGGNYSYVCEQLKSIRQDMTVQGIRDRFAITIYEYHARIALQAGDLSEYNQCQSQLRTLYTDGSIADVSVNAEFTAYEILYLLFSGNRSEMNALLDKRAIAKEEKKAGSKNKSKALKHAQAVRSSLAVGNYHKFFELYRDAPNRNALLMDQFVPRERVKALLILCKSFPMGLPLDFITTELSFYNTEETIKFLESHGLKVDKENSRLETKSSVPHLQAAINNKYKKADIKGQI